MKSPRKSKGTTSRTGQLERITTETQIKARLTLDGKGKYDVRTGIRFLDHMLELFAKHGGFDLELKATGDLDVDQHHTVEDVGIVLGECIHQALGDKRGINRAGYFIMPLDESLAVAAVDFSGRPYLALNAKFGAATVGDLQTELVEDFFQGFANHAKANVHLKLLCGRSTHHGVEAMFKTFARAVKMAVSLDPRLKKELPSTKGLL
ncbi:MAG: imidazoleglycerol-phosphate dehydratase [Acidobacteria bacterium RIFCSPLOWO2_12_FULL_54_10]|nr:MAG: imidazoleglycerol-phosphate dehydratase [Acidobacteria bacterium RIFCSPLOWO2_12_FULL_54_10]